MNGYRYRRCKSFINLLLQPGVVAWFVLKRSVVHEQEIYILLSVPTMSMINAIEKKKTAAF